MIKNFVGALVVSALALSMSTAFAVDTKEMDSAEMMAKCQQAGHKDSKECKEFMMQHKDSATKN